MLGHRPGMGGGRFALARPVVTTHQPTQHPNAPSRLPERRCTGTPRRHHPPTSPTPQLPHPACQMTVALRAEGGLVAHDQYGLARIGPASGFEQRLDTRIGSKLRHGFEN